MSYFMPETVADAVQILTQQEVAVIAGGTDYYPALGEQKPSKPILDISRIDDLQQVARSQNGWRIGAAARWSDLQAAPLPAAFDGLKAAAASVGAQQIQNAGTIGGNLCNASPAAAAGAA